LNTLILRDEMWLWYSPASTSKPSGMLYLISGWISTRSVKIWVQAIRTLSLIAHMARLIS